MKYNGYEVGPVLRNIRKNRNLTVDKVSELAGISTSAINQIEQGGRNLSMKNLFLLMEVYQVDANTLLGIEPHKDMVSIDQRLKGFSEEKREYFLGSFLFMLENAAQFL